MAMYDLQPDLYGTPINGGADHPDMRIEVYMALGDDDNVYIIHDKPFQKTLSWIEYDSEEHKLDFIMEDGDLRDFGIPVNPSFQPHLINTETIAVAEVDNGVLKNGGMFPLMKHGGL